MGEITQHIDTENQTSVSVSMIPGGEGSSRTEEQKAFISEEQRREWFEEFKEAFEKGKVQEVSNKVSVMKLPALYRVPENHYTPKKWFFGLHNRDVQHLGESEDLKIALAAACELEPWDKFCESVVENPVGVLRAYGLGDGKFSKKQVQYFLTLDALTIFFVFAFYASGVTSVEKMQKGVKLISTRISGGYAHVPIDLFLFENQIPLDLLKNVIRICYRKWGARGSARKFEEIVKANVSKMCGYIFELTNDDRARIVAASPASPQELENCPHIVAFVYKILCGDNSGRTSGATMITIQSATSLKRAGIQIKGIEGVLDKVRFGKCCLFQLRKRCLFLPIIKLYDQTESYFRNLAMYEFMTEYNTLKCPFGEYLQLMTDLIREEGDVKHLIDCGVIKNRLGTDNNAFQMWNSLQSDLFLPIYSDRYRDMVSEINEQCKSSRNVMGTEFCQEFCSRPWYVIGAITATIVTLGTCIQAYTAVIGSDKMKPHFPP